MPERRLRLSPLAASSALLAGWRPEKTRLGLHYDMVLCCSVRLNLPAHLGLINEFARHQFDGIRAGSVAPLHWLGKTALGEIHKLVDRLDAGWYKPALALDHRLDRLAELLDRLVATRAPTTLRPSFGSRPGHRPAAVERCAGLSPESCLSARSTRVISTCPTTCWTFWNPPVRDPRITCYRTDEE
ncbi:hypothetical protein [Streptomyces sp. NPDC095817]|uniref:hypothetical protein n=1 Tax=Streptomyces sp. NPDC095817 TaxID=3155082 RepID=UPI00331F5BB3